MTMALRLEMGLKYCWAFLIAPSLTPRKPPCTHVPQQHLPGYTNCYQCVSLAMTVILLEVETNATLLCPGDTLSFHCAVISSVLDLQLVWRVTYPGHTPVTITYNATALPEANHTTFVSLGINVSSFLTALQLGDRIESVLAITVPELSRRTNPIIECGNVDSRVQSLVAILDNSGVSVRR